MIFRDFQFLYVQFLVVYHEHRFDKQHQAKIIFEDNKFHENSVFLFTNCETGVIFRRIRSALVLSSRLSITANNNFDALS